MTFLNDAKFYVSDYDTKEMGDNIVLLDPEYPNWIATDKRGEKILSLIREQLSFREIVNRYSGLFNMEIHKGWLHVNSFIHSAIREGFISLKILNKKEYTGRSDYLIPNRLTEFWIHINNNCNLSCLHCLVGSDPKGNSGLSTDKIKWSIDQACDLGVSRFFITGGEPFIRSDIFELINYITVEKDTELIVLTNGTLLTGRYIRELANYADRRLRLQISLDGSTPEVNDTIRGKGSFSHILQGIKNSIGAGFSPTITTVVNRLNIKDISGITDLISKMGIKNHHLLWPHPRGRAVSGNGDFTLSPEEMLSIARDAKRVSDNNGLVIDNYEVIRLRVNSYKGIKYDGNNACWQSLCIYFNGDIYPSASLVGLSSLSLGNIEEIFLKDIWLKGSISEYIRRVSLVEKEGCSDCSIRYICGGGDMESTYLHSLSSKGNGGFHSFDPYCSLYKGMILDAIFEEVEDRKRLINRRSGFDAPLIFVAKGQNQVYCHADNLSEITDGERVETIHSNCVLSIDIDISRQKVRDFYGKAAEEPQQNLCCPTGYDSSDTSHIPDEVLKRFYGCGSPINLAEIKEGEIVIDLGSGAGIDCFIAEKYVGRSGGVIGIDMTAGMLEIAEDCKEKVAKNLGYNVVEFRRGFLEEIPVDDRSADIITSNCVINLSPDKRRVFREMWRVLKDFGRIVVSDIVSEDDIPPYMQANPRLWGECISGALTEDAFIAYIEEAGFYGISIIKKLFWKEVEGHRFFSITVRGYKYEKREGCIYKGQMAIYIGPYKSIMDEEGHLFPRNEAIEICTDTALKLSMLPYRDYFVIIHPDDRTIEVNPGKECCKSVDSICC